MRLIDADGLKDFLFSETSGTEEVIRDLMMQHNLDYANDVNEDEVMDFAKGLLKKVRNVIDTELTAYNIDKIVKELEKFNTDECTLHECGIRSEFCGKCMISKAIEIVENGLKEKK